MKRDLAYPMRYDGNIAAEYREHRRKHGWLRDLTIFAWFFGWGAVALVLFFAIGSVQ